MATQQYHVYRWVDGVSCKLAATFDDLADAEEFVRENNGQPGGDTYGIDPADLPPAADD